MRIVHAQAALSVVERDLTSRQIVAMEESLLKRGLTEEQTAKLVSGANNVSLVVEVAGKAVSANSIRGRLLRQGFDLAKAETKAKKESAKAEINRLKAELAALKAGKAVEVEA